MKSSLQRLSLLGVALFLIVTGNAGNTVVAGVALFCGIGFLFLLAADVLYG